MFQTFPADADISPSKRVKFGIDPTFPRLHLGHLVPLRLVKKMMGEGHQITIVLGTFTAQLGDPSGRDTTRPILSQEEVENNADQILLQIQKVLGENNFGEAPGKWTLCRNNELHKKITVPEFLRRVAKFTLNHMTSRNAFQNRIENNQSIGMHELLVPICQGWDSVALNSEIEIGGQDQLFNFQIARQLQESEGQKPQTSILMPIINGTDGRKMSKSLGNCIFLNETPQDIFGKVMSIPDQVMDEWFPLLTDGIPQNNSPINKKKILAVEIVSQLHSTDDASAAHEHFTKTVQNKELPQDIPTINTTSLIDAICQSSKISKTAARQRIKDGAIQIDGVKIFDEKIPLQNGQIIKTGKRDFAKIHATQ
jgi:tyrosyl-tRNA synthetase